MPCRPGCQPATALNDMANLREPKPPRSLPRPQSLRQPATFSSAIQNSKESCISAQFNQCTSVSRVTTHDAFFLPHRTCRRTCAKGGLVAGRLRWHRLMAGWPVPVR